MLDTLTLRAAQTQNEPPVESSLGVEPTEVDARDSSPDADPPQMPQPVRREPRPCESKTRSSCSRIARSTHRSMRSSASCLASGLATR
jgi:hypothetical protein